MASAELLGSVEFSILDAVHRGRLRSRRTAHQVFALRGDPAGEALLHAALHRFENGGLLRSTRDGSGRRYELTAAGRARLRAERRFRTSLVGLLARSHFARV